MIIFYKKAMERNRNVKMTYTVRTEDTNSSEVKCLLGLLLFCGVNHDTKQPVKDLWYSNLASRPIYRGCFSLKRYEWLMANIVFHNQETIQQVFLNDRFAKIRWLVDNFEKNAREIYRHTPFTAINETPRNFYSSSSCNFKVDLSDKNHYQPIVSEN